jgi:predicted amidophosphoribosyltransferase
MLEGIKLGGALNHDRPAYRCVTCGEVFDLSELVHCPHCHHHYPAGSGRCHNCHRPISKTPSMRPSGLTVKQEIAVLDFRHHFPHLVS